MNTHDRNKLAEIIYQCSYEPINDGCENIPDLKINTIKFIDALIHWFSEIKEHSELDCSGWIEYPCPQHDEDSDYEVFDPKNWISKTKGV
jgi:hypothetical protein